MMAKLTGHVWSFVSSYLRFGANSMATEFPFNIETPETPSGCFWYFLGFSVLVFLVLAFVKWMW
jgi:hypothetical protein